MAELPLLPKITTKFDISDSSEEFDAACQEFLRDIISRLTELKANNNELRIDDVTLFRYWRAYTCRYHCPMMLYDWVLPIIQNARKDEILYNGVVHSTAPNLLVGTHLYYLKTQNNSDMWKNHYTDAMSAAKDLAVFRTRVTHATIIYPFCRQMMEFAV